MSHRCSKKKDTFLLSAIITTRNNLRSHTHCSMLMFLCFFFHFSAVNECVYGCNWLHCNCKQINSVMMTMCDKQWQQADTCYFLLWLLRLVGMCIFSWNNDKVTPIDVISNNLLIVRNWQNALFFEQKTEYKMSMQT